jgi:hypothetical protein
MTRHWPNESDLMTDRVASEKLDCYNVFVPTDQHQSNENPYKSPRQISEPQPETPSPEQHWAWAITKSSILLLSLVLVSLWWYRQFGGVGLAMLIGGFMGSCVGLWISKERWWGVAGGAIVGFTAGAVLGVIWLFTSL